MVRERIYEHEGTEERKVRRGKGKVEVGGTRGKERQERVNLGEEGGEGGSNGTLALVKKFCTFSRASPRQMKLETMRRRTLFSLSIAVVTGL